jgi:peptide subunit release factor 1 (eRF1)
MITRENIRDLANFECPEGCAISFYFQPGTPQNKSHREEAILVKDLVREAMREAEKAGRNGSTRSDLERIVAAAERLHGNHARGRAIFACGSRKLWQEFDVPPRLPATKLFVNRRFHLRPLAAIGDALSRTCVLVVDRSQARIFEMWLDEVNEKEKFTNDLPRRGRGDGWGGYDAGHAERHVGNEAMQFFKQMAGRLRELPEGGYERFWIGCREEIWPLIEPHLHPYVQQRLAGHFHADPAAVTADEIRKQVDRLTGEQAANRRRDLVRAVIADFSRDGRGALGLKRVLQALETREAQMLLLSERFSAAGAQCSNCGHLDAGVPAKCPLCGHAAAEFEDISDAVVARAVQNGIEVVYVKDEPEMAELSRYDGIAARLRFRADQNTEVRKAG